MTSEQEARKVIDSLLVAAGWVVCDVADANIHASAGVAIREFPLQGYGFADYLLYLNGRAVGVVEAKKAGTTLTGVETQSDRYAKGLPPGLPYWSNPLPFSYQSTGVETRFTNGLDPHPRSRNVFAFHKPETLLDWLNLRTEATKLSTGDGAKAEASYAGGTFLARLQDMPKLVTEWGEHKLWPAQIDAIRNLEKSLAANKPRALIQMATGSGKTFTAISFIYRLIKFAGARRVLFLVDRGNLGDQTLKEFQQYASPYNNFKFTEEYIVQRLSSNTLDTTARVCICTIQRLYSMLKGRELPEDLDEVSPDTLLLPSPSGRGAGGEGKVFAKPDPIDYNPSIPIETFDVIVTDECHRSIYNLWAQVLEYFDAYLIGLTATPSKQTFGFFRQNLVMEYNHEMAVADGVNVNYDVYRIRTAITEQGSKVDAGYSVQIQERDTRKKRWEELDDDFSYDPNQLDRDVVAPDQIRKIVQTYRDKLFTEIFPGREWVPKTLIFAKDDAHAENIVEIVREEFGNLAKIALPVPPPDQQKRIVAEIEKQFSRLDEAVTNLKRVKANLKRYKAAVLKAAVEGRLVETEAELARREGRSFETGEQLLQRILETRRSQWKDKGKYKEPAAPDTTDLPRMPEGWVWATPDQLSASGDNAICAGPFGTIFKAKDFRPMGVPIIFLRHVSPGRYLKHKPGFMDKGRWEDLFQPYSVYGGELLVTKLGEPPGVCAIYPEGIGPAMVTPDVIKMTVNNRAAISSYLMHYFNSDVARKFSSGAAFGTTRLRLTIPMFREMPVALPPLFEQHRIVDEVDRRFSLVQETEKHLETNSQRAERLRQSVLGAAFSGAIPNGAEDGFTTAV